MATSIRRRGHRDPPLSGHTLFPTGNQIILPIKMVDSSGAFNTISGVTVCALRKINASVCLSVFLNPHEVKEEVKVVGRIGMENGCGGSHGSWRKILYWSHKAALSPEGQRTGMDVKSLTGHGAKMASLSGRASVSSCHAHGLLCALCALRSFLPVLLVSL